MSTKLYAPIPPMLQRGLGLACWALLLGCPDSGNGALSDDLQLKQDGIAEAPR